MTASTMTTGAAAFQTDHAATDHADGAAPRKVYLDNAATTPLAPEVLDAMMPYLTDVYGNANSLHTMGREAFGALQSARTQVASCLGVDTPQEIYFTSGGTEGDNIALMGLVKKPTARKPVHVIVSSIEHHAVLLPAKRLSAMGYDVTVLAPRKDGFIHPDDLEAAMRDDTALVSVMYANNEIGTIQPIVELGQIAHDHGALFHTDAVQALGKCPFSLSDWPVDAASFSTHKVYGPKGSGILYVSAKNRVTPLMLGGGQENGLRSGTQDVACAVGCARAIEIAESMRGDEDRRLRKLQSQLVSAILQSCPDMRLAVDPRGDGEHDASRYLPNIVCLLSRTLESETMALRLDEAGYEVSGGSACSTGSLEPSHVMKALGIPDALAFGELRISLGRYTTKEDVEGFVDALVHITGGGARDHG